MGTVVPPREKMLNFFWDSLRRRSFEMNGFMTETAGNDPHDVVTPVTDPYGIKSGTAVGKKGTVPSKQAILCERFFSMVSGVQKNFNLVVDGVRGELETCRAET